MFDSHTMEVLIPSVLMVAVVTAGMVWAFIKMRKMIDQDSKK